MDNQSILQYIMIGIVLLCGYLFLLQTVTQRTENKSSIPIVSIILLLIYLVVAVPVLYVISTLGSTGMMLIALLLLFTCVILIISIYGLIHHFRDVRKGMLAVFVSYLFAVAYITVFSRGEENDTSIILINFKMINEAIRTRSLEPLNHAFLNIAMFVPLGFLFPMIYPEKLTSFTFAAVIGMACTTIIETVQLMLKLGQADLTDIVTNVAGALIGYFIFKIFMRFRKPEEEE